MYVTTWIYVFAECRSITLGKEDSINNLSTIVFLSSTLCQTFGKVFAECQLVLGKKKKLCRVLRKDTRQTNLLQSVEGDTQQRHHFVEFPP